MSEPLSKNERASIMATLGHEPDRTALLRYEATVWGLEDELEKRKRIELRMTQVVDKMGDDLQTKNARHQEHLRLIRRLSTDSISPEDAAELQAQVAALVSQVGTCRGYVRELLEILDDTCAKKWRARLAEIKKEMQ